jgi:membrane associated rhomboid family serine protease
VGIFVNGLLSVIHERIGFCLRAAIAVSSVLLLIFVWFVFGVIIGVFPWSSLLTAIIFIGSIAAFPGAAGGVLLIARWLNRRDDPRRTKRQVSRP